MNCSNAPHGGDEPRSYEEGLTDAIRDNLVDADIFENILAHESWSDLLDYMPQVMIDEAVDRLIARKLRNL